MRRITAILLFLAVLLLFVYGYVRANDLVPRLYSDETITADIDGRIFAADVDCYDEALGGYHLRLRVPENEASDELYLNIFSAQTLTLLCNSEQVLHISEDDIYTRTHSVVLTRRMWEESGALDILAIQDKSTSFGMYLTDSIAGITLLNSSVYFFVYGLYLTVAAVCFMLFHGKHSEKYLLVLAGYVIVAILPTLFTQDLHLFNFSFSVYRATRNVFNTLSHAFRAFTCLSFAGFYTAPDAKKRRMRKNGSLAVAIPALLLFLFVKPFNTPSYFMAALTSLVIGIVTLPNALRNRQQGAVVLIVGYAMSCSVSLYGALTGWGVVHHYLNPYLRVALLENIPFAVACLCVVLRRFSARFSRSDTLNTTLGAQVAQRELQLQKANEDLQGEQRRKHSIMTNIFHDLRNPLFTVKGCVDMLERHTPDDERLLGIVDDRLSMVRRLTEDLFLVSKLEEEQITFLCEPVNLSALCESITQTMRADCEKKQLTVVAEIAPERFVMGDAFRLRQAIENMLNNAEEYSPEGGKIELKLFDGDNTVCISVKDYGRGISQEDIQHIFERYYHSKLADKQRSSGLGLAIAQEIIHKHGGEITVDSEKGEGTEFTINLPAVSLDEIS